MKTLGWIIVLLAVLLGDWAALHDILGGSEPDVTLEWTWLVVSTLALVVGAGFAVGPRRAQGE